MSPRRFARFGRALPQLAVACLLLCRGVLFADPPARPKYGPQATRLFAARDYLRTHEAPDFWALVGYYVPQRDDRSCSLASAAMVLNGLRADADLSADDELLTQDALLARVDDPVWNAGLAPGGNGVSLDEFAAIIERAWEKLRLGGSVEVVHVDGADDSALGRLRQALAANEQSADDFLIANFLQSELTGDPEGAVGHMAPIAAYDAAAGQVLIFDPDRRFYEPYWVSIETLLAGMATRDADGGRNRGYVVVRRDE